MGDPEQRDAKIETSNLRRVAIVLGDNITDVELEAMIAGADKEGKGYVSCEDYYELMVGIARKMEESEALKEDEDSDEEVAAEGLHSPSQSGGHRSPRPLHTGESSRLISHSTGTHQAPMALSPRRPSEGGQRLSFNAPPSQRLSF